MEDNGVVTPLKLQIWDVAGEGKTQQLAHLFVRGVQVAILVYSINSKPSFQNLDTWLEHLEESNNDFMVFLVGNKTDLEDQRAVSIALGEKRQRHTKRCEHFFETSAYTDVESILGLFDTVCKEIVRKK